MGIFESPCHFYVISTAEDSSASTITADGATATPAKALATSTSSPTSKDTIDAVSDATFPSDTSADAAKTESQVSVQFVKKGKFKKMFTLHSGILSKGENGTIIKRATRSSDNVPVECVIINKPHGANEAGPNAESVLQQYGQKVICGHRFLRHLYLEC